ncbi:putative DNA repair protein XRCC3 [Penaeus vannamei]|uniref:Putative DNA repair protein XRCC3 n=1 Tax=Penaeus vannamei TaxID=6689 RepID=A0A423T8F7_PENVA|nr:putative DNA repair protein XRCC3 [Penaeus vannamei]
MALGFGAKGNENIIDALDINPRIITCAKRVGFVSAWQFLRSSEGELQQRMGLSAADIDQLLNAVTSHLLSKSVTAWDMSQEQKQDAEVTHITTGCQELDEVLGGGIPVRGITEVAGESSSGKTQLALQLALHTQLPSHLGGLGKGVAYICTESQFPDTLVDCVRYQLPRLIAQRQIGLVIIDSIAAAFRAEDGTEVNKTIPLQTLGYRLHQLAFYHKTAVVAINQVAATVQSRNLYDITGDITPALGLSWSNLITTRLLLRRTNLTIKAQQALPPHPKMHSSTDRKSETRKNTAVEYRLRKLEIVFSPWLERKMATFMAEESVRKEQIQLPSSEEFLSSILILPLSPFFIPTFLLNFSATATASRPRTGIGIPRISHVFHGMCRLLYRPSPRSSLLLHSLNEFL